MAPGSSIRIRLVPIDVGPSKLQVILVTMLAPPGLPTTLCGRLLGQPDKRKLTESLLRELVACACVTERFKLPTLRRGETMRGNKRGDDGHPPLDDGAVRHRESCPHTVYKLSVLVGRLRTGLCALS